MRLILFLLTVLGLSAAQTPIPLPQVWQMQNSGTTAGLRGIDSVYGTVAWASGTSGTVLKTVDGGTHWTQCAVPDGDKDGATLDFRGVQAWDATTAIVMASGPGDKSRLYRTTDGCKTWRLVCGNEDKDGFWDALRMWTPTDGFLVGDPINGGIFLSEAERELGQFVNGGFIGNLGYMLKVRGPGESLFAASNSSIALGDFNKRVGTSREVWLATGGPTGARVIRFQHFNGGDPERIALSEGDAPMFPRSTSAGIFAIGFRKGTGITVGGDYAKPNDPVGTAARSVDSGNHWTASTTPPHGYRSTVQWSESLKLWITAGTNGSDISRDDGKTWRPLDNGNWNALSLPFIVGPKGRIARLNPAAIPKP